MKKFFVYTVKELFEITFEEQMDFKYEELKKALVARKPQLKIKYLDYDWALNGG